MRCVDLCHHEWHSTWLDIVFVPFCQKNRIFNFMKSSMSQMGQVYLIVGCYRPSWFVWLIENLSAKIQVRALVYCRYHIAILNLCQTVNNGLSGMLCDACWVCLEFLKHYTICPCSFMSQHRRRQWICNVQISALAYTLTYPNTCTLLRTHTCVFISVH